MNAILVFCALAAAVNALFTLVLPTWDQMQLRRKESTQTQPSVSTRSLMASRKSVGA